MENLILVAAIGANNELGLNNKLIWKIKEDLQFYRNLTLNKYIIMGRKTFESMPIGALQKRKVIVLSNKTLDQHCDIISFTNLETLLEYIEMTEEEFIVVGGASIYKAFLPYIDTMYLTEIKDYSTADTFFPDIEKNEWDIRTIYESQNGDVKYIRNKYVRRRIK